MLANVLSRLDTNNPTDIFGPYEEEMIISLALDFPEYFIGVGRFITVNMFSRAETKYVLAEILKYQEEFGTIPTRALLDDYVKMTLTEDYPWQEILRLINRKSDPREVPMVKKSLTKWARQKAFGLIYSDEAQEAFQRGDYAVLEEYINAANRIGDVGNKGIWLFEQLELLFQDNIIEHYTTGFQQLNAKLNDGGPSPGEVLCWLAATNVGKSILLCNNAVSSVKGGDSLTDVGRDTLLVTFELDVIKTAMRCLGSATGVKLSEIRTRQDYVRRVMQQTQSTYGKRMYIYELPPDECSVNHIYAVMDNLRRMEGWRPEVVVLDYLELMVSRNSHYNKDDYTRQKHVATEVRGLAKNERVLVFTATQTNRSGGDSSSDKPIDLNKSAESYGKNMPLDYVVSLNQSDEDRRADPPRITFFIAKNRNGPKHESIECTINYDTMQVREAL